MADLRNDGPPEWGAGTSPFARLPFPQSSVPETQTATFFSGYRCFQARKIVSSMGTQGPGPQHSSLVRVMPFRLAVAFSFCYCLWPADRNVKDIVAGAEIFQSTSKSETGQDNGMTRGRLQNCKGPTDFNRGPGIFTVPNNLKLHFYLLAFEEKKRSSTSVLCRSYRLTCSLK